MKISINGKTSAQKIIETFTQQLVELENLGVQEFSGINFYCHIHQHGEKAVALNNENTLIEDTITDHTGGKHKRKTLTKEHSTIIEYDQGFNIEQLQATLSSDVKHFSRVVTETKYDEILEKQKEEVSQLEEIEKAKFYEINKGKFLEKEKAKVKIKQLKELLLGKKNPNTKEFLDIYRCITEKNSKRGLAAYLDVNEIPSTLPCFRVSKRGNGNSPDTVEIFDNDLNLIKTVVSNRS